MRRRVIICLLAVAWLAVAQKTSAQGRQQVSSEYDRNSLTILFLDAGEKYSAQIRALMDSLRVPEKFFDNTLSDKGVPLPMPRQQAQVENNSNLLINRNAAESALNQAKIGQQLMALWFQRGDEGSFGVELLKERGVYNATDNDVLVAGTSKRGEAGLMDMGMGLVDRSYLILLDFAEILTMAEMYERDSVPANERIMNGFMAKMNAYVYKLNFSEEVAANFFQNMWVTGSSDDKAARIDLFNQTTFPLTYINTFSENITATQLNPGQRYAPQVQRTPQQLLQSIMTTGLQQSLLKLENTTDAFRVKGMVFDVNPIAVKIGRKEGLKFDQRYFVYENRQNRRGDVYSVRKGVIKAMSVSNNLGLAEGASQPSFFYQTAGKRIDNMGMFVEQKNATGVNFYLGYTDKGLSAVNARMELYISPLLYEAFVREGVAKGLTSFKLYIEGGLGQQSFTAGDFTFAKISGGLGKEIFVTRNVHIEPFLGYGLEMATTESDQEHQYNSQFIELGSRLGINLTHSVQLIGAANLFPIVKCEKAKKNATAEDVAEKVEYGTLFEGRSGLGLSLGIRFMF